MGGRWVGERQVVLALRPLHTLWIESLGFWAGGARIYTIHHVGILRCGRKREMHLDA